MKLTTLKTRLATPGASRIKVLKATPDATPLWKGGADDEANLQSLCQPHHDEKTAQEAAERAGR
jgi:5-methylcytosine-specific restriction endonuclease McrA